MSRLDRPAGAQPRIGPARYVPDKTRASDEAGPIGAKTLASLGTKGAETAAGSATRQPPGQKPVQTSGAGALSPADDMQDAINQLIGGGRRSAD